MKRRVTDEQVRITYKLVIDTTGMEVGCENCDFYQKAECPEDEDENLLCCKVKDSKNHIFRETLPSRISRAIKRMVKR